MTKYSQKRKDSIIKKLLPPYNMTISALAKEEGITTKTLYNWRAQAVKEGHLVLGKHSNADDWSAETKLSVVIETATMSESDINQYCRTKGLFKEQLQRWKQACLNGFSATFEQEKTIKEQSKIDKSEIKSLKKELRYKEKALSETAALLVLRKKLNALWEDENEER